MRTAKKIASVLRLLVAAASFAAAGTSATLLARERVTRPAAATGAPAAYEVIDLGTLGGGWTYHERADVNTRGQVVGGSRTAGGAVHAFLWEDGRMRDLGTLPGRSQSVAMAINEDGVVVGSSGERATLWAGGRARDLGVPPGFTRSWAHDINDRGQVVGRAYTPLARPAPWWRWPSRAVVWFGGKARLLPLPEGFVSSRALATNARGQIAGWGVDRQGRMRALLWEADRVTELGRAPGDALGMATALSDGGQVVGDGGADPAAGGSIRPRLWAAGGGGAVRDLGLPPGHTFAKATAINDGGQVVGDVRVVSEPTAPFLWEEGRGMRSLGDLIPADSGWALERAFAISGRGEIVCWGRAGDQRDRLCLLRPLPLAGRRAGRGGR